MSSTLAAPPPAISLTSFDGSVDKAAISPFDQKDAFLASFPGEPVEPKRRSRWRAALPTWGQVDTVLWAAVPLVLHLLSVALMIAALLQQSPDRACMSLVEKDGNGRLDYFIFNSCVRAPGSTSYDCTRRSLNVDFTTSVVPILSSLPGVSSLKLPQFSDQTPSIMVTTVCLLFAALVIYIPLWILAYFPRAALPTPVVRFYRYFAYKLYLLVGTLAFIGFIFAVTIGVGYKLFLMGYRDDFKLYYRFAVYASGSSDMRWEAHLGSGFDLIWAASTFAGATVVATNIALHNGMDERVEWPEQAKR
ncbi:hypothetical protein JCM6882_001883 [Rhodosporidiobolus microsporus]